MSRWTTMVKRLGVSDRLIRRNPALYRPAHHTLVRAPLDAGAERRWIDARLKRVLAAAASTPYGRSCGAPRHLGDWPILEKDAVREDPRAFLARRRILTASASTSGTTGTPLLLRRSFASVAHEQAVLDWLLERIGVDPRRCRAAVLRGDDIKAPEDRSPPYWRLANGGRRLIFSSNHLDRHTAGEFIAALEGFRPEVLLVYPTVLGSLAALILEQDARLKVPLTVCSSEVLTEATRAIAEAALGTRVLDYYGQAERAAFAYQDGTRGYRFLPTYSINELRSIDAEDDGDADVYELIGTSLWNLAMPLVRYRTGDLIRLRKGANAAAVAAGREPFLGILGRNGDYLIAPTGARLMGIDHIPRDVPRVLRAQ
ncbi:MAG: hypothetical protein ACREU3_18835, partial [Steroidobacteraceae bacterium]